MRTNASTARWDWQWNRVRACIYPSGAATSLPRGADLHWLALRCYEDSQNVPRPAIVRLSLHLGMLHWLSSRRIHYILVTAQQARRNSIASAPDVWLV